MKIRRRMGETKQIVQVNGGNILLFELASRLLTLPLLLQAVAALFRLSVRASGYSYVTVSNLVSYLLRPVTIAILVLMAAILLVGVSIEAAGLLAAYQAAALSRKMSAFSMFAAGIRLTVSEIRKRNLRLFLVLAVHGLVLHSFLIYRMLCHVKAVKFILPALLAENWGRLLLVGVIVGAVVISLPTIFICFGCMLEQRSFRGGFLRSRELLRGNRVQVVGTLVLCNLAVTAVTVVLYLIAVVIVAVFDVSQSVIAQAGGLIQGSTDITPDMLAELETTLEGMDLGPLLGLWLQSSIIGVTMWALGIVIFVLVYGRMLEIYLLTSLAPIPMATLAHREVGQTGQNYLRSLFAVGFQGMLILVCVAIYAVLVQGIATSGDPIGAIWGIVGYTVLLCFMLFKTGGIAQRIFGAH